MPTIIPWQPMKELQALQQQMDHLLDTWTQGETWAGLRSPLRDVNWLPAIEVQETETELIVKAEIPRITAEELTVEVGEKIVTIQGEHREEHQTTDNTIYRSEFHYGQFYRQINLPTAVQNEAAQAQFKDGLLTLTLPKQESSPAKVVKISLADQIRSTVTENRQQDTLRQEQVESRAEASLHQPNHSSITEETRATVVQDRKKAEHLEEKVHLRATEDLRAPSDG
ncbi:MAG: Hsp20/alpha crystallin family protein [Synechococcales bacterium]|nr:Hsp20/alpha crystallin family protein [Synechococcales bacterium]